MSQWVRGHQSLTGEGPDRCDRKITKRTHALRAPVQSFEFKVQSFSKNAKRTQGVRENHAARSPGFSRLEMNSHERAKFSDTRCSANAPPPEGGTPNSVRELPNEPMRSAHLSIFIRLYAGTIWESLKSFLRFYETNPLCRPYRAMNFLERLTQGAAALCPGLSYAALSGLSGQMRKITKRTQPLWIVNFRFQI